MTTIFRAAEFGWKYAKTTDIEIMACPDCGITFGMPHDYINRRRADKEAFYCPNGHSLSYRESEADRLKKRVERLENARQWEQDQRRAAEREVAHQRRVAAAARGNLTKMRKRIANGVCPVPKCKRSGLGRDVVAHILTCHPTFHIPESDGAAT